MILGVAALTATAMPARAPAALIGPTAARRPAPNVVSAELFNRRTGIVVTERCRRNRCRSRLHLTRNLGSTWRDVTPGQVRDGMPIRDVYWLDRHRAWAIVGFCDDALIVRTKDGGGTWKRARGKQYIGCHGGAGVSLDFVDRRHGFLGVFDPVAESSHVRRTRSGGRRWSEGHVMEFGVGPVDFRDRRNGYLAARFLSYSLHYSNDGGRSWTERHIERPPGYGRATRLHDLPTFVGHRRLLPVTLVRKRRADVAFYGAQVGPGGWSLTSVLRARVYMGKSKYFLSPVATSLPKRDTWWAFYGRGAHVRVTRDGGRSWSAETADVRGVPTGIDAVGGRTAWITTWNPESERRFLYVTRNRGRTWRPLIPRR